MHQLEADGIMLEFDGRRILSDIYLSCRTGKITGLLGRNGQGKTCLLRIIYGDLPAQSKSVRIDGSSIPFAFRQHELIQYLPQHNFIPMHLSVDRVFSDFDLHFTHFEEHFSEFKGRRYERFGQLSGGERRLVEVYLLIQSPSEFALLDEPFSHITPVNMEKVQALLQTAKIRKGFIITDHLYRGVVDISDTLYVLANGKTSLVKDVMDIERLGYARIGEVKSE